MARISDLRLLRARLEGWRWPPWAIVLLFVADLAELCGSLALAAMSPAPAPRVPYASIDVPYVAPVPTLGVAMLGAAVGLVAFASLVGELYVMVRRAQILRWRYAKRPRAQVRGDCSRRGARRSTSARAVMPAGSSCSCFAEGVTSRTWPSTSST